MSSAECLSSRSTTHTSPRCPREPSSIRVCSLSGSSGGSHLDLRDGKYSSAIAMVHSRFSTNTMPSWERAHPNRFILHNGEINTIRGNADRMLAREETMSSEVMKDDMDKVLPVITASGSDSAMLDNTLEFLVMNGIPLPLAVMIMIPEPWKNNPDITREKRDLYHYYATMMEPWDGPAADTLHRRRYARRRARQKRTQTVEILYNQGQTPHPLERGRRSLISPPIRSYVSPAFSRARCCSSTPSRSVSSRTRSARNTTRRSSRTASGSTGIS